MTDEALFGAAVVGLLVAIALGFRRWGGISEVGPASKFILISTALGGLIGACFWWFDLPASFAWDLPPVGSRMLAVAALAFGVAGLLVLERPSVARIRLYFTLIALYLIPLALAVVLLHLDRFDFTKPVTYGFFSVVIVLSIGALANLLGAAQRGPDAVTPPDAATSAWLLIAGCLLGVWGVALFATPAAAFPLVFNWPTDPLTSRLIAAMLVTLAAAFLLSRANASLARVSLAFGGVYGIGVLAACLMNISAGKPVPPLYAGVLGLVGVVSLALSLRTASTEPATRTRVTG